MNRSLTKNSNQRRFVMGMKGTKIELRTKRAVSSGSKGLNFAIGIGIGLLVLLFSICRPASALANPGDLDLSFGSGGKVVTDLSGAYGDSLTAMAIQQDGKIVVAGATYPSLNWGYALVRYNTDGSMDPTFGVGGKVVTQLGNYYDFILGLAVQTDGKILAAGGSGCYFSLVRYNSDGSLDAGFGSSGVVMTLAGGCGLASAVALQSDGRILLAGNVYRAGTDDFVLVRYNTNGTLDASFGSGGIAITDLNISNDYATALVVQSDGNILVGGASTPAGSPSLLMSPALVRYNSDGVLDASFGANGKKVDYLGSQAKIHALTLQSDGRILAGGYIDKGTYTGGYDFVLVRYNADGSLDPLFGTNGSVTTDFSASGDIVRSLVHQSDGKILAAGSAFNGSTHFDFAMARYHTDGSLDPEFGVGGRLTTAITAGYISEEGYAVTIQADGKIVAAGTAYTGQATATDFALVRYAGSPTNRTPLADAGSDSTAGEGSVVSLNGSASTDPDQDSLAFQWTQIGGPSVLLSGTGAVMPSFIAPAVAVDTLLTFQLTVHDGRVDSAPDLVNITVQNVNQPPDVGQAQPSLAVLWSPDHKMVSLSILGVTDPDGDPVTIAVTQIRQDEPVEGTGDGDQAPDASGIGTSIPELRAERSGNGNGRVYAITFEARDDKGGLAVGLVTVGVPHSQGKDEEAIDDGASYDSTQSIQDDSDDSKDDKDDEKDDKDDQKDSKNDKSKDKNEKESKKDKSGK